MNKLILSNKDEIKIENGSSLSDVKVLSETKYAMVSHWEMFTEENLKHIEIRAEDGTAVGTYEDVLLDNETSTIQTDGTILTSFRLRKKTDVELLKERVKQLEYGQEVHGGAISDLGEAVSGLADEGGLA